MRVRLKFKDIQEIRGGNGWSVLLLTDEDEQRALTVVCDTAVTEQFRLRLLPKSFRSNFLPEVLVSMLKNYDDFSYELNICNVDDGHYKVTLLNKNTLSLVPIRMSDAVLLHHITGIPIYIDSLLMNRQCTRYVKDGTSMAIPINTISTKKLAEELQKAIDAEDYRLAAHLNEELKTRKKQDDEGD